MSSTLLWIVLVLSLLGVAQCGLPFTKRKRASNNLGLHEDQDAGHDPDDFLSSFLSSFTKTEEPESPPVLVSPYTTVSDPIPIPDAKVQDIQPRTDIVTTIGTIAATVVHFILKKKLFIAAIVIAVLASFGLTGSGGEDLVNVVEEADRIQRVGGTGIGDQIRDLVGDQVEVSALMGDVDGLESYLTQGFKVLRSAVGLVATSDQLQEDVNYLTPSLSTATSKISAADETDQEEVDSNEVFDSDREKKEVADEEVQLDEDNQVKTVVSELQGTLKNLIVKESEPIFHDVRENIPHEDGKTVNLGIEVITDTVPGVESDDETTNQDSRKVHDLVVANIFKANELEEKSIEVTKPGLASNKSIEVTKPGLVINNQYQNLSDFDWLADTDSSTIVVEDDNQATSTDIESSGSFGVGKGLVLKLLTPSVKNDNNNKDNPEIDVNQEIEGVTEGYKELLATLRDVEVEFLSPTSVEPEVMINQVEAEKLFEEGQSYNQ